MGIVGMRKAFRQLYRVQRRNTPKMDLSNVQI